MGGQVGCYLLPVGFGNNGSSRNQEGMESAMPSGENQDSSLPVIAVPCTSPNVPADAEGAGTDGDCRVASAAQGDFPDLMTEPELIRYLRIPDVSNSKSHRNVIEHLKRFRGLPRIHICNKALYPKRAIQNWIDAQTSQGD